MREDETVTLEKGADGKAKQFKKVFAPQLGRAEKDLVKLRGRIAQEEKNLEKKNSGKDIALGTSKINYNDPRISVSWCKLQEVPIEKVFPKTLMHKFAWAMRMASDWKF